MYVGVTAVQSCLTAQVIKFSQQDSLSVKYVSLCILICMKYFILTVFSYIDLHVGVASQLGWQKTSPASISFSFVLLLEVKTVMKTSNKKKNCVEKSAPKRSIKKKCWEN